MEEEKKMQYVTSIERLGREEGLKDGRLSEAREMVLEAIDARFQVIPEDLAAKVKKIDARKTLKSLLRKAVTCQSIDALREAMADAHGN